MRARHRLSKMLLRQGILYTGGKPWTGVQDAWLRAAAVRAARPADRLRDGVLTSPRLAVTLRLGDTRSVLILERGAVDPLGGRGSGLFSFPALLTCGGRDVSDTRW